MSKLLGVLSLLTRRGTGTVMAVALVSGAGLFGVLRNGQYEAFVAANGAPRDIVARLAGFGIQSIAVSGAKELDQSDILGAGLVSPTASLPFLDADDLRTRLMAIPLVKDASVRKLYPDKLAIDIVERQPFALWQKDGVVNIVAADGTPIDLLHSERFTDLPFVVGEGANLHVDEFMTLVDAAEEFRSKIRSGIYVGGRRWTLHFASGLDVALPEDQPLVAVKAFAKFARESRVLDKDVLAVDMRVRKRIAVRLSGDAAAARADLLSKKKPKSGAPT